MKKMLIFYLLCVFFLTSCNTKEPGAESQPQSNENITSCPFIPRDVYSPQNYNGLDIELTFWIKASEEPCGIWGPLVDFFEESPKIDVVSDTSEFPVGETIEGTFETKTWDGFVIHSFVPTASDAPVILHKSVTLTVRCWDNCCKIALVRCLANIIIQATPHKVCAKIR